MSNESKPDYSIPEDEEDGLLDRAEKSLIHGNFSWNATLKITVVEARSLKAADDKIVGEASSDPYCSVKIGQDRQQTEHCESTLDPKVGFPINAPSSVSDWLIFI